MNNKRFRPLITVYATILLLLLINSCSSVSPNWPPIEKDKVVTIVGPIYLPQFGSNYQFSKMARQILRSFSHNQAKLKTRSAKPETVHITLEDWILRHEPYLKNWERIHQEEKSAGGTIDNAKLASIIKESGIHKESHVLVIHVKTLVAKNPASVQLEGYRYLQLSEEEYLANMFHVNIQIKDKDPRVELESALIRLIISNDFASPSFDNIGFVQIQEGCFQLGRDPDDEVCVDEFRLSKTPITQRQWTSVMKRNHALNNQGDVYPVTNVSWEEIQKFLEALSDLTDREYRLPTDAEWEYACRNLGSDDQYGTVNGMISHRSANYAGKEDLDTWASSSPVGMFPANKLGLYDMSGNVWEWTQDREHKRNFMTRFFFNYILFMIPEKPSRKIIRGGSFDSPDGELRCIHKDYMYPKAQAADLGFRLVLEDD